jgi:Fur family ferric uptake transcriptional regulator
VKNTDKKKVFDCGPYQQTGVQKDIIIQKLKESGCRITKQRLMILDIILEDECSCCKEIYYKAARRDDKIGAATVYRMINILEEIGAISRKNMYKIVCDEACGENSAYVLELDDGSVMELSEQKWYQVVSSGLKECGYRQDATIIKFLKICKKNS